LFAFANLYQLDQHGTGPGARSSHAIAIVGQKAYVFGGEFAPRVPVDNKIHVFDLETLTWSVADANGDVPPPRVGVSMVPIGKTIYVFGGRDVEHNELNELYSFDTLTNKWTQLSTGPATILRLPMIAMCTSLVGVAWRAGLTIYGPMM